MKLHFREPFNGISHLIATYLALAGLIALVLNSWDEPKKRLSLAIYGASLTLMLAASTAYHSLSGSPQRIHRLRKIDHASIFLLIAGTYTPLTSNLFTGFWQWGTLIGIWSIALVGMVLKAFTISSSDWFIVSVYLLAGWFAVMALGEIFRVLPIEGIAWLFGGGVIYSLGAVLSAAKKLDFKPGVFGHHEVWHLFVIAGAFCHFMLILRHVVPA